MTTYNTNHVDEKGKITVSESLSDDGGTAMYVRKELVKGKLKEVERRPADEYEQFALESHAARESQISAKEAIRDIDPSELTDLDQMKGYLVNLRTVLGDLVR